MERPKQTEWLMIVATAAGPLVGVWVTRWIDKGNAKARRREAVFETMVKLRGLPLSPEYVAALNMVPLLFSESSVRQEYSRLMAIVTDGSLKAGGEQGAAAYRNLSAARNDLTHAIGVTLETPLPAAEFERNGYAPEAWDLEVLEAQTLRRGLIEVVEGRRPLHMVAGVFSMQEQPQAVTQPEQAA